MTSAYLGSGHNSGFSLGLVLVCPVESGPSLELGLGHF